MDVDTTFDKHASSKNLNFQDLKLFIINHLDQSKAIDIKDIDLEGKADFAKAMVIASATSSRHAGAIADKLIDELKAQGVGYLSIEGREECSWVLIDALDIVIHIFKPDIRLYYNLEKMWEN